MATVLITGASGGIGRDLAELFAKQKYNLILVARSKDTLDKIAFRLAQQYGIRANCFNVDLSQPDSAKQLYNLVKESGFSTDILVNNAGVGSSGEAVEMDIKKVSAMLTLNMTSLTELSLLFGHDMKQNRSGKILNISSTAAFQSTPYLAAYAASKAYVLSFSEALYIELKKYGVTVTTVCPGPTETSWAKEAGMENSKLFLTGVWSSKAVAQKSYDALMKKRMSVVIGWRNKFLSSSVRFFPRKWVAVISGKLMQ